MCKILLIGVDGGNLELIERWKDELPTFNKLMKKGVYGKLESTIPPATIPGWNCIFTGKNPGKLGLYDFIIFPFYQPGGLRVANYLCQDSPSLWDILSAFGKKVQIINVPIAFPPKRVNGLMVSGGLSLPLYEDVDYTYPPELKRELNDIVSGGYEVLPFTDLTIPGKEEEYLKKFLQNIEKQIKAVKYLIQEYDWDFLTYIFQVTDHVQHYFWHHMDETHPKHDLERSQKYKDAIEEVYKKVDEGIKELLVAVPKDTNILVVSDHGGGPLYGYFMINEWLKKQGLLSLRSEGLNLWTLVTSIITRLKNFLLTNSPRLAEVLVGKIPRRILQIFLVKERERDESTKVIRRVNWPYTKAYGLGSDGSIFINLKGREPEGTVEVNDYEKIRQEISELLHEIRDPFSGNKVVTHVFKREDIYSGKHVHVAPDLWYILDGYKYVQRVGTGRGSVWVEPECSGGHNLYGICMAYGPSFKKESGKIHNAKIYDIAPTVLHLMGLPIPEDMDGRVLNEIFAEDSEPLQRPIVYQRGEEKEKIRERIKRLKNSGRL